jgi:hypothetical protein
LESALESASSTVVNVDLTSMASQILAGMQTCRSNPTDTYSGERQQLPCQQVTRTSQPNNKKKGLHGAHTQLRCNGPQPLKGTKDPHPNRVANI